MIRTLIGAVAALLLVGSAHAQIDHLECFKVKDRELRARYKTTLESLVPPHGCVIKVPAKLMCLPTARPEVSPAPPGAGSGTSTGEFLCYQVRCRRSAVAPLTREDRFGKRVVKLRRSRLLCVPVPGSNKAVEACVTTTTIRSGGTTTTTTGGSGRTTTTVTPTTTSTTTTTLFNPAPCSAPNTECGTCTNGLCQPRRDDGQFVCSYQTQGFCSSATCQTSAQCAPGSYCVGASGDAKCCQPCL